MTINKEHINSYERRLLAGIERISKPDRDWMPPERIPEAVEVAIIGGGQAALALTLALRLEGIKKVVSLEAKEEGREGVWQQFARMATLRTPKTTCGMDLGIPELTAESWYRATFGAKAWEEIDYIPLAHWAQYLTWYRKILAIPVRFSSKVKAINPTLDGLFRIDYVSHQENRQLVARRVILANGVEGSGSWSVPDRVSEALPPDLYSHTCRAIDFNRFKQRRVAVIGAGASAYDNAICALEAGAERVDLFCRAKRIGRVNAQQWAGFTGFLKYHADQSDREKWRFFSKIFRIGQLPSVGSYRKANSFDNFLTYCNEPDLQFEEQGGGVLIRGNFGRRSYAHLICGTGFKTDLRLRPELRAFVNDIKTWSDTAVAGSDQARGREMMNYPYLKPDFTFVSRTGKYRSWLDNLYCFNYGALISNGLSGASITGLKYSVPKIVTSIGGKIYSENLDFYYQTLLDHPKENF